MNNLISKRYSQFKWYIKELIKTFSNEKSYFSSKRINNWLAFVTGQSFLWVYFLYHYKTITYVECLALAGTAFTVAGYHLSHTQREKKTDNNENKG